MSTSYEPGDMPETGTPLAEAPDGAITAPVEIEISAAGGMLRPFRIRNFSLLTGGQTISTIGDAFYAVALPWLILNNGGSAQELGIVLTAYGLPRVGCVLVGGWLTDRLRPRRLMLLADVVRAVLAGVLAVLALRGHPGLWELCAISVALGALHGAFLPAASAILPDLLHDEDLQAGNALSLAFTQAATLVGSAIAGIAVATLTAGAAFALDAGTFAASALSLAMMRVTQSSKDGQAEPASGSSAPTAHTASKASITTGRFLRSSRLIQVCLLVSIAANFCFGGLMEVALPTLVHGPMNGGASGYGLILAAFGAGALGGGLSAGMLGHIKRKGLVAMLSALLMAVAIALLPYGGVLTAAAWMLLAGIANSITNVILLTVIQMIIPRHLMGRIMGILMFASFGTYPLSVALAGVLTTRFGPQILFPYSGLVLALAILYGITQRALREL
jgi:hypothetical protein